MKAKMIFSEYQKQVFNFVANGAGNAVISAVAGSGKTTTIVEAAKLCKGKQVLFLAFNKSIANELAERLVGNTNVTCKTLHAHGLAAIKKYHRFVRVLSFSRFTRDIKERMYTESQYITLDSPQSEITAFRNNTEKLLHLCRINLVQAGQTDAIEAIADNYGIMPLYDEIEFVSKLLKTAYTFPTEKAIDFDDMLTLPIAEKRGITKYDVIFIDECQDLSKSQRELMLLSLKDNGRFIAVGDRKQAINGFAGAQTDSFDLLANISNTQELPLSVCYRCGKSIIDTVKHIVPNIEAAQNAADGIVEKISSLNDVRDGDMLLSRVCAPLVSLCLRFWSTGRPAYVKGNDLAEQIVNVITKSKQKDIYGLLRWLDNEAERLEKQAQKNKKAVWKLIDFKDKKSCIESLCNSVTNDKVSDIIELLEKVFSDGNDKAKICLSTIHKAKGLESERCFVLTDKLPLSFEGQKQWEAEQEQNLIYVAYTRAKKELYLVDGEPKKLESTITK